MSYAPLIIPGLENRPRRVIPLDEPAAPAVQPTDASHQALAIKETVEPPTVSLAEVKQAAMPSSTMALREPAAKPMEIPLAPLPEPARPAAPLTPIERMNMTDEQLMATHTQPLDETYATRPNDPGYVQLGRVAPSYKDYRAEKERLPTEAEYVQSHTPHGFWQRTRGVLGAAGKALVRGGPVAALASTVANAIDPTIGAKVDYRQEVEPRSYARQQRLLGQAGAELSLSDRMLDNDRAERAMELQEGYRRDALNERNREWRERLQEKTLNDWMARNPGVAIPRSVAQQTGHPELAGYVPPARKTAQGRTPHVLFNERTGEVGVVTYDDNDQPTLVKPQGGQMMPSPSTDKDVPEWAAMAEAQTPEAYGVKSWDDLIDNPEYGPAYNVALEQGRIIEPDNPEQGVATLMLAGNLKLPPKQIPAYEYARRNPYVGRSGALRARQRDQVSRLPAGRRGPSLNFDDAARKFQQTLQRPPINPKTGAAFSRDELKQMFVDQARQQGIPDADIRRVVGNQ